MKTSVKVFHWLPRILCILAILFISMFALDAFAPEQTIWQQIGGFLMHLIPSFVLIAFLIIAWKWELIGGIIFILAGLITSPFIYTLNHNRNRFTVEQSIINAIIVAGPFIIVGILFIISNYLKKKNPSKVQ